MMTSQVVRALEAKQLVRRYPDAKDARARRVEVTAPGAALAPRAIEVVEAVDRAFFSAAQPGAALTVLRDLDRG
jgi:DNA-binding MarR family transcriptional regulator